MWGRLKVASANDLLGYPHVTRSVYHRNPIRLATVLVLIATLFLMKNMLSTYPPMHSEADEVRTACWQAFKYVVSN